MRLETSPTKGGENVYLFLGFTIIAISLTASVCIVYHIFITSQKYFLKFRYRFQGFEDFSLFCEIELVRADIHVSDNACFINNKG